MQLNIQSIRFTADEKLTDYIQKKLNKLDKIFGRIIDGEVFLKLEKDSKNNGNKIVEIKINLPKYQLFAKEQGKKFEDATNLAYESLAQQLKKAKDKLTTHK